MTARIVLLPGDGIGPEITAATRRIVEAAVEMHGTVGPVNTSIAGVAALAEHLRAWAAAAGSVAPSRAAITSVTGSRFDSRLN